MATAPSPAPGSTSGLSIGIGSIAINKNRQHPEQWTLPNQWNIEKREAYENWKVDLQCQIAHMDKQLCFMTQVAPQADVGIYPARVTINEEERLRIAREEMRGKMQTGVRRS